MALFVFIQHDYVGGMSQHWNITSWNSISLWIFARAVSMPDAKCFCCSRDYYGCVPGIKRSTLGSRWNAAERCLFSIKRTIRLKRFWSRRWVSLSRAGVLWRCSAWAPRVHACSSGDLQAAKVEEAVHEFECLGETFYLDVSPKPPSFLPPAEWSGVLCSRALLSLNRLQLCHVSGLHHGLCVLILSKVLMKCVHVRAAGALWLVRGCLAFTEFPLTCVCVRAHYSCDNVKILMK